MPENEEKKDGKENNGSDPKEIVVWQIIGNFEKDEVEWKLVGPSDDGIDPAIAEEMRNNSELTVEHSKKKTIPGDGSVRSREIIVWQIKGNVFPVVSDLSNQRRGLSHSTIGTSNNTRKCPKDSMVQLPALRNALNALKSWLLRVAIVFLSSCTFPVFRLMRSRSSRLL